MNVSRRIAVSSFSLFLLKCFFRKRIIKISRLFLRSDIVIFHSTRSKSSPPAKVSIAPAIPTVTMEELPVGGSSFSVGLTTIPPFVCICEEGEAVGAAVLNGAGVTVGVAVGVGVKVGVTLGVGVGLGVGVKEAGGLVCCPEA